MKQQKILVVDDDLEVLSIYSKLLRAHYHVDTTDNPHDALNRVTDSTYAAIITDYTMPGMNGTDLIAHLRNDGYAGPTLLITGEDPCSFADLPIEKKPTLVLQKPVRKSTLIQSLEELI
ncbi:response regulator [Candidatus Woesearchaeota archaeon]|nr:response regulator [Candidatus Woesearchaeota archaeon]